MDEYQHKKCEACGKAEAENLHTCPLKEAKDRDASDLCNCCEGCERECRMDS